MSDGKERPGLKEGIYDWGLSEIAADQRSIEEVGYDLGAHASLAQQAAFAQACAPRGDDPRPGLAQAMAAWVADINDRRGQHEFGYDAGRTQGRQETLLACAEERVLAASQPMSGEVRRDIEERVSHLEVIATTCERANIQGVARMVRDDIAGFTRILAMGTRTDVTDEVK